MKDGLTMSRAKFAEVYKIVDPNAQEDDITNAMNLFDPVNTGEMNTVAILLEF